MKIESGVMLMKDDKAWGITYEDGRSTSYGWMDPEDAPIHDPRDCKKPTDVTWKGSYCTNEIKTGKLVFVERRTEVIIAPNQSIKRKRRYKKAPNLTFQRTRKSCAG